LVGAVGRHVEDGFERPVHHCDELAKFVGVVMGFSLLFRGFPAFFVGNSELRGQGLLLCRFF
jgi:hypothetical protein